MKLLVGVAVLVLLFALAMASTSTAQEPPLDLGEQSILLAACDEVVAVGNDNGLGVRACRRAAPDEVSGYRAKVTVDVYTAVYGKRPFRLAVSLRKSLWSMTTFEVVSGP